MATSFVREKHHSFPRKSEKELTELLKKYQNEVEVSINDLRAPEARWWQEILFVLLKRIPWIHYDHEDFMNRVQSAQPANRGRVFLKLLLAYWNEIALMAFFKPPLETLDLIRPSKERVISLLSAFINLDAFISSIPSDPNIESFSDILEETKKSEEHIAQLEARIEDLEEKVARKKEEVARNADRVYQLKCEADRVAQLLQNEKDTFEEINSACEEKLDAIHSIEMKIEDLQRQTGHLQSEIDRNRPFHVPDVDAFLKEPITLRNRLEELRTELGEVQARNSANMELIKVYQHLDEEIRACSAIVDRNLKLGRELDDLYAQLNSMEESFCLMQDEYKRKLEEHRLLQSTVADQERQQLARQQRPVSPTIGSQQASQASQRSQLPENPEDDGEIKGRLEEGEALMKNLQKRERLRQQCFAAAQELDQRYHEKRDRLADNHDQFIEFIRGMMDDLIREGLIPALRRPEDEENDATVGTAH